MKHLLKPLTIWVTLMTDNKSLMQIANTAHELEEMMLLNEGEITPEAIPLLNVIEIDLPQKVDAYYGVIERMEMLSNHHKEKANVHTKFSRSAEKIIGYLKSALHTAMESMHTSELKGNDYRFKLQNNPISIVITDESLVPDEFKKTIYVIEKDKIKEAHLQGKIIPGVTIVQDQHLRKYMNSPNTKRIKE